MTPLSFHQILEALNKNHCMLPNSLVANSPLWTFHMGYGVSQTHTSKNTHKNNSPVHQSISLSLRRMSEFSVWLSERDWWSGLILMYGLLHCSAVLCQQHHSPAPCRVDSLYLITAEHALSPCIIKGSHFNTPFMACKFTRLPLELPQCFSKPSMALLFVWARYFI